MADEDTTISVSMKFHDWLKSKGKKQVGGTMDPHHLGSCRKRLIEGSKIKRKDPLKVGKHKALPFLLVSFSRLPLSYTNTNQHKCQLEAQGLPSPTLIHFFNEGEG